MSKPTKPEQTHCARCGTEVTCHLAAVKEGGTRVLRWQCMCAAIAGAFFDQAPAPTPPPLPPLPLSTEPFRLSSDPDYFSVEDSGQALIFQVDLPGQLFVRLQSWDEKGMHEDFNKLRGKKLRITIEEVA
jgi:hypothetical protein